MKKQFAEPDKEGYPYFVSLPLPFWLDEELKEWLLEIGII